MISIHITIIVKVYIFDIHFIQSVEQIKGNNTTIQIETFNLLFASYRSKQL